MSNSKAPITINNWGEVKQKLFFEDRQIVNATKRVQPSDKAQALHYKTKDGVNKTFYFADEVTVLDVEGLKLKKQLTNDLMKRYMAHEISADQFTKAVAELG